MMTKTVDVKWYLGAAGTVGFVLVYHELLKEYYCYTGTCQPNSESEDDIERIKQHGAKVEMSVAQSIFPDKKLIL